MFKLRRYSAALTLAAAAVLVTAGSALAYWSITGSGTGTATVATVQPLVIEPVAIVGLVIGQPLELEGVVTNPNPFDVSVIETSFSVEGTVDEAHQGCVVSDNFQLLMPSMAATSVLANSSAPFGGGSIMLVDRPDVDQAECQGATITLEYTLR